MASDLEIVVCKTDQAETGGKKQDLQHLKADSPETDRTDQARRNDRDQEHDASHRRCSLFFQMRLRTVVTHFLPKFHPVQHRDEARREHDRDHKRYAYSQKCRLQSGEVKHQIHISVSFIQDNMSFQHFRQRLRLFTPWSPVRIRFPSGSRSSPSSPVPEAHTAVLPRCHHPQ